MKPEIAIEAVLFYKTEPIAKKELGEFLGISDEEVTGAIASLGARLRAGATRLVDTGSEVQLASAPEVSEIIEKLRKDELSREIGKAGAETLAIVLYLGAVSRAQIDFIRGVNSGYILRNLQVRGLIKRLDNPHRANAFQYAATPSLYAHLGVERKEELPQYASVMDEIDRFETDSHTATEEAAASILNNQ